MAFVLEEDKALYPRRRCHRHKLDIHRNESRIGCPKAKTTASHQRHPVYVRLFGTAEVVAGSEAFADLLAQLQLAALLVGTGFYHHPPGFSDGGSGFEEVYIQI